MKFLVVEKISEHRYKDNSGYLICLDCICSRTGKQTYTRDECFGDGDQTEIEVDRKEDDVFAPEALASFENKPITIEHPSVDVTPENYKDFSVGYVRDIHKGEYEGKPVMLACAVITDPKAIELVESGKLTNLSCGYDCDVEDVEHPCQKNIRGNHIALCEVPRAGITHIQDSKDKSVSFETLKGLFDKMSKAVYDNDIDNEKKYLEELENKLPFKNDEEHSKWLDIAFSYKFWEDFEEFTMNIMNRAKKANDSKQAKNTDAKKVATIDRKEISCYNWQVLDCDIHKASIVRNVVVVDCDIKVNILTFFAEAYIGRKYKSTPFFETEAHITGLDLELDKLNDNELVEKLKEQKTITDNKTLAELEKIVAYDLEDAIYTTIKVDGEWNGKIADEKTIVRGTSNSIYTIIAYVEDKQTIDRINEFFDDPTKYTDSRKESKDKMKKDAKNYTKLSLTKTKNDYGEYCVKCYVDGKFSEIDSYLTDDWQDAVDTFNAMANRLGLKPNKVAMRNYYTATKETADSKKKCDEKETLKGIDDWIIEQVEDFLYDVKAKHAPAKKEEIIDYIFSLSDDITKAQAFRVYNYVRNKFDNSNYFDDSKKTKDTRWVNTDVKKGSQREQALRQYLDDNGFYYEPSSDGDYVHFEIKVTNSQQVEDLRDYLNQIRTQDNKSKRLMRKRCDSKRKLLARKKHDTALNGVAEVIYDVEVKAETQLEKKTIIKWCEDNDVAYEVTDFNIIIYFDTQEKKESFFKELMNNEDDKE